MSKLTFVPTIYSPYYLMVNKDLVQQCHKNNIIVAPPTVNTKKEMEDLKALGVDGTYFRLS